MKIFICSEDQAVLLRHFEKILGINAISNATVDNTDDEARCIECYICFDPLTEDNAVTFKICKHSFCEICVDQLFGSQKLKPCPMCRAPVRKGILVFTSICSHVVFPFYL